MSYLQFTRCTPTDEVVERADIREAQAMPRVEVSASCQRGSLRSSGASSLSGARAGKITPGAKESAEDTHARLTEQRHAREAASRPRRLPIERVGVR